MANMLEYEIVLSEFELQSCYSVHFLINILSKGMNSQIPAPAID